LIVFTKLKVQSKPNAPSGCINVLPSLAACGLYSFAYVTVYDFFASLLPGGVKSVTLEFKHLEPADFQRGRASY